MTSVGTHNEATRVAWVEKVLSEIPSGSRILDAGAGEQQFRKFCSHLNYVSQDFAQYDGKGDSAGLQTEKWDYEKLDIVSDIMDIPEPDESFDAVMCTEVLEHLPNPLEALKEFSRLLRSNGQLIITAPFCSLTHFAPYHFYTGYNRYFYEYFLPAHGFEIVEIQPNGNFFEYLAQEIHRLPSVADRYTKDRPRSLELLAMRVILRMLKRFTRKDTGSSELLCHGYHLLARKTRE